MKTVLVTGAAKRIGRGIALRLHQAGYRVAIHYGNSEKEARAIGVVSGLLSSSTAFFWLWANWTGRLPEPERSGVEEDEVEIHGDPVV
jgi:NAD(P)-dependent dehydrogenase (short-subunit alcohol dehydrogenase family)